MNRREFVKYGSSLAILLASGELLRAGEMNYDKWSKRKPLLRFVVASDGHYGQKDTGYQQYYDTLVNRINQEHESKPFAFCMVNGDIVHDDKAHYPAAKQALDKLSPKYYVSQGNHDLVSPAEWEAIWSLPVNHHFSIKDNSFLIATTSNEQGAYLCPDISWVNARLEELREQKNVFIFLHINPAKQTKNAVDCPELLASFSKYKNIRAVFNGHDHDESGIKMKEGIPFIFDAHFGGDWGTSYRGFRVVELLKDNSIQTYIMDPLSRINEAIT
jgi:Icc protein